jgi:hypothetical protein
MCTLSSLRGSCERFQVVDTETPTLQGWLQEAVKSGSESALFASFGQGECSKETVNCLGDVRMVAVCRICT